MARGKKAKAAFANGQNGSDETAPEGSIAVSVTPAATKLRVFISWSGARSKSLAQSLHGWLPLVLHFVEPWLSDADIEAGDRWADAVASELEASNFGIICVTRESVTAPWLLFEAGALAKSLAGSVVPLLLDIDFGEVTGPLAQFQAKKVEKAGVFEVVRAINSGAPVPVSDARLTALFGALWPEFEKLVNAIPAGQAPPTTIRPQGEILDELVGAVRALDSRLRDDGASFRNRRARGHQAKEAHSLVGSLSHEWGDPTPILVLASLYREDAPWIHELAIEAYRAARQGQRKDAHRIFRSLRIALEFSSRSRNAMIDGGFDDDALIHFVERYVRHAPVRPRGPPPAPATPPKDETVAGQEPETKAASDS